MAQQDFSAFPNTPPKVHQTNTSHSVSPLKAMDGSSYFPSEFGNFDDEFYQYQTSVDGEYQNNAQPIPFFEGAPQSADQIFGESYVVGSNQFQIAGDPYLYEESTTGLSSTTLTETPVEGFQYIDFGQSEMPEPQASLNMHVSPVGVLTTTSTSTPKDKRASHKGSSKNPPHSHSSSVNTSSSHKISPRSESIAVEPSSNVNSRSAKKSKGPPKSLLTVFDSNIEPHTRRKSRSAFSEEGKKKVEAVRRVGACIECRFRKRTVSSYFCGDESVLTCNSVEQANLAKDALRGLAVLHWQLKYAFESHLSQTPPSPSVSPSVIPLLSRG